MKKLLTMMLGLLLIGCAQQNDLTFNEMVNQTQEVAKGIDTTALFYESTATKELTGVKSVFAGVNNTTIEVLCDSNGKTKSKVIDSPFMEDEVIKLPVKLTLEDAEQILLDAGYGTGVEGVADWSEVVLRRPLEPGFNVAQYIFTTSKGFVSVNATTGSISPVSLEGCPCPFTDPCICPEPIVNATGGKIKFTNKTEVPICYALWTDPRIDGFPASNYGVIKPGESHEYSKNSGDYSITACMSGDMGEHHDWLDTDFPGISTITGVLELGFQLWHNDEIDWENIKNMSGDDLTATFGKDYTWGTHGNFGHGGGLSHFEFEGGPAWIESTTDPDNGSRRWRVGHQSEGEVVSTPFKIHQSN